MKNRFKAGLAAFLALVLGFVGAVVATTPASANPALEDDVRVIKSRLMEYFLDQGDDIILANNIYLAKTSEALDYVESQNADGSWDDVDYTDRTSSANQRVWSAYIALYRMMAMSHAYQDPSHPGYQSAELLDAVERALLHWDIVDPGNTNWWETEIGESIAMGRIQIFLGDDLSEEAFDVALKHNTGRLDPVGANGVWRTTNYLYEALATYNFDNIRIGFDTVVQTVRVDNSGGTNEAVQPDNSFWAHGAQLYSEGYGMVLFTYAALWADVARGTDFALNRADLDSIAFYIIGGTRWLIRGEIGMMYLNYRPVKTIHGVTRHSSEFIEPFMRMARTDPLYSTAYQAVLDSILDNTKGNGVTGNKYMWRSEFSSHLRDDYGIFTRLNSNRTVGSEYRSIFRPSIGNEIIWNSAGATAIQVHNDEYRDLGPAFDWFHYPGVTAPYYRNQQNGSFRTGGSFTGGVSDGTYGANVYTLNYVQTQAKKSYFNFDDEMVALGADIASTGPHSIHTTVNQAVTHSNATVNGAPIPSGSDSVAYDDVEWAYNDQVGYVFPTSPEVRVSNKTQTGNWIDHDPVSVEAFTLHFDHGVTPTDAGYEYIVLPAKSPAEVEAYAENPAVEILQNDGEIQAVTHPGLQRTMATFYQAGSLTLADGRTLEVSQPAIVILDESGDTPVVSVANPSQPNLVVYVTLTDEDTVARGHFELGAGTTLGKTVTSELSVSDRLISDCTASSELPGHEADLFCDGDINSYWHSGDVDNAWVSTRLPYGAHVTGATIDWGDDHATTYILQTSTDGETWTDQQYIQGSDGGQDVLEVSPTPATHARLLMLDSATGDGFSIREFTPDYSINLALGRQVTASGGSGVGSVVDGSLSTRWSSNLSDTAWIQVDLGSVQPIQNVRIHWETSFSTRYKVQVSDDGATWRDAYVTPSDSAGGVQLHSMDENARYVRMQSERRAFSQYGVSIWEFEVFGDTKIEDAPEAAFGKENLALRRPIRADSTFSGFNVAAANDGSLTSRWASARQGLPTTIERWLEVELDEVSTINQVFIKWEGATSTNYRIEGSLDQQNWEVLATYTKPQSQLEDTINFPEADAKYVRVIGLPATQYGISIFEFEIYGGYNLTCEIENTVLERNSTGVLSARISPLSDDDTFRAFSLDSSVASVTGEPRVGTDGLIEFDVVTGDGGSTTFLVTHSRGDEFVWCPVSLAIDTSELEALVETANELDSRTYTPESWDGLLPALEHAKDVLAQTRASQDDVDGAAAALAAAIDGLVEAPVVEAPSVPRDVDAAADGDTVTVTWVAPEDDGGADITAYEVRVGDEVVTVSGSDLTAEVSGLEPGTYVVTVRAQNSAGWSEASAEVTVEVTEPEPVVTVPSVPRDVNAVADGDTVTVTWAAPEDDGGADITAYEVRVGDQVVTVAGDVLTAEVSDVPTGTHVVTVRAQNSAGWSLTSDEVTVEVEDGTDPTDPTAPSSPREVAAEAEDDTVTITWVAPISSGGAAITAYEVTLGDQTITVDGDVLTAQFTDLEPGTYSVTVRAQNEIGWSEPSDAITVEVADPEPVVTVPSAPQGVDAVADSDTVTVTWSAPEDDGGAAITAYEVTLGDQTVTVDGDVLEAVFDGLEPGVYSVTVRAQNSAGWSEASAEVTVEVAEPEPVITVPSVPRDVAVVVDGDTVTVSWSAPEDDGGAAITAYEVRVGDHVLIVTSDELAAAGVMQLSASDDVLVAEFAGLEPGIYSVTVRAQNEAGWSAASEAITVEVEETVEPTEPPDPTDPPEPTDPPDTDDPTDDGRDDDGLATTGVSSSLDYVVGATLLMVFAGLTLLVITRRRVTE